MISKVLDDPTVTEKDLKQLNDGWDDLCQESVSKQDRLDEARLAAEEFDSGFTDMKTWIDQEVAELLSQAEPDEDAAVLQQQIDENKV